MERRRPRRFAHSRVHSLDQRLQHPGRFRGLFRARTRCKALSARQKRFLHRICGKLW